MLPLVLFALLSLPPTLHQQRIVTPIDRPALVEAMRAGHVAEFGREPSAARLGMGVAVVSYEGAIEHSVCRNLGNIGADKGQSYCRTGPARYRAFATFADGARAFWHHFATRCRGALMQFDAGDPVATADAMRRCGYYRASVETYRAGLRGLYRLKPAAPL